MFLLFILATTATSGFAISCFSCVSPLPESTPKDAQIALKSILSASYNLPLVDKYCEDSNDAFFKGVPRSTCGLDDRCVKISAKDGDLSFVIRGCQKSVYREGFSAGGVACSSQLSPSICVCKENLCNSADSVTLTVITFIFATFILIFAAEGF